MFTRSYTFSKTSLEYRRWEMKTSRGNKRLTHCLFVQVELTGSSVFDYIHPGDHVEMAEQLGMKLPPGRGMSLSQGAVNEDGASSASSSSHSETPEPGRTWGKDRRREEISCFLHRWKQLSFDLWSIEGITDWSKSTMDGSFCPQPSIVTVQ